MNEQLVKILRDTLNNLYNPDQLHSSPLVEVFGINSHSYTTLAMQKVLENLIQALKPRAGDTPRSQKRRSYDLLYSRYVDQFSQKEVADQLGVSLRTYQREQQTALELLATLVAEKYPLAQLAVTNLAGAGNEAEPEINNRRDNQVDEFDWMFQPSAERSILLDHVIERLKVFIQPLVIRYSVNIVYDIEPNLPAIAANPEALLQVLVNLLSVFLHHAVQGNVQMNAHLQIGSVLIELVTSPFMLDLLQTSETDEASLKIVRHLVQLSEGSFTYSTRQNMISAQIDLPVLEALPILVIDDSMDNIKLIQRYLSGTRYRVIGLTQPEQAWEVIKNSLPQAVILDLMMPQVDGLEILTRLRTQPSASLTPIIVCTILPQEELALSLGASAFLQKPISRENLLRVLDQWVLAMGRESDQHIE